MTPQEEHIIISRIKAGDIAAFAHLVDAYKDRAVVTAFNILLNREDAEEVVQDAFVKSFQSLHGFREAARFSSWFFRIVVNTALNKRKASKGKGPTESISETIEASHVGNAENTDTFQVTSEHRKHIQTALQQLPANERLCLTLFYLHEYAVNEVSGITGLSESNIKVLLHRGRKRLHATLQLLLQDELTNLI